eukprot:TRINITY_DN16223_c0_g1_i1.p1 TRINITY_DN16223_c0_g1~~TRINITY_DN16223_c0_g1_i1.p1  ORF type:complete len:267 (+),score=18.16 TRINITY_DN16223_c0_g1_i1:51-851(+)
MILRPRNFFYFFLFLLIIVQTYFFFFFQDRDIVLRGFNYLNDIIEKNRNKNGTSLSTTTQKIKKDVVVFVLSPNERESFNATYESLLRIYNYTDVYIYTNEMKCNQCKTNETKYDHFVTYGNTFDDDDNRVKWRTKIVLDYVKLLDVVINNFECEKLVTTEDDVIHEYSRDVIDQIEPPFSLYDTENGARMCSQPETFTHLYSNGGSQGYVHNCTWLRQFRYFLIGNAHVKPLDWLVEDFYKPLKKMLAYNCNLVRHQPTRSTMPQ